MAFTEGFVKKINLIGAGLIGVERMKAIQKLQKRSYPVVLQHVFDPYQPNLKDYAATYGFKPLETIEEILAMPCDLLVIACPHDVATDLTCRALIAGHKVLMEKPMGRFLKEAEAIGQSAAQGGLLWLGLNYRFMPGLARLRQDLAENRFGPLISLNMKLGHGGKPGDEKIWKLDPVRCGGGALLDPGIHLLDLVNYLLGEVPTVVSAQSWSGFWKTGIEEEVHLSFRLDQTLIHLQVSVVTWISTFEVIVVGTDGYGKVIGRGRSYGPQVYRRGQRWGWLGGKSQTASEEEIVNDSCENSFADEIAAILGFPSMVEGIPVELPQALELMRFYEQCRSAVMLNANMPEKPPLTVLI